MDQELKQRLIGAVVVTALAAIFIPMLFDDPVDQSGQVVSELVIPAAPVKASEDAANKLPANADEVLAQPDQGLTQEETEATINEPSDTIAQSDDDVESVDAGVGTDHARDAADREQIAGQHEVAANDARRHHVAAERAHLIRLLHRQEPGGIGAAFDLRHRLFQARGLDDVVGAGAGAP